MAADEAIEIAETVTVHLDDRAALFVVDHRRNYHLSWLPRVSATMLSIFRKVRDGVPIDDEDRDVLATQMVALRAWITAVETLDAGPLVVWDGPGSDPDEAFGAAMSPLDRHFVMRSSRLTKADAIGAAQAASARLPSHASLRVIDDRRVYAPSLPLELAERFLDTFGMIRNGERVPAAGLRIVVENEIDFLECFMEELDGVEAAPAVVWSSA